MLRVRRYCDGTAVGRERVNRRPWVVLRISDEYDVLAQLDERREMQTPVEEGARVVDRITTSAGNTYYFELRRAGRRPSRSAA